MDYAEMVRERSDAEYDEIIIDRMLMTLLQLQMINSRQDWNLYKHLRIYWSDHRLRIKQLLRQLNG